MEIPPPHQVVVYNPTKAINISSPVVKPTTNRVSVGVQTTPYFGEVVKLEPFHKAVERFRMQMEASRQAHLENSNAEPEDIEKMNKELFEKIQKILGPEICEQY